MKIRFLMAVLVLLVQALHAQVVTVNYNDLLAGTRTVVIAPADTQLVVANVLPGKGAAIRLEVRGSKKAGEVTRGAASEAVRFHLRTLFRNRPSGEGKLWADDSRFLPVTFTAAMPAPGGNARRGGVARTDTAAPAPDFTGIGYWDALAIFQKAQEGQDILAIVNEYAQQDYADLDGCRAANLFFDIAYKNYNPAKENISGVDGKKVEDLRNGALNLQSANVLAALSGMDVTQYVQAFADFLRDRIKEELTRAYIDQFRRKLESKPEFTYLLPKTINVFNTGDIFNFPALGASYRTAFAEDMEGLPENFERMVYSMDAYRNIREADPFVLFMSAYYSVKMSAEKYHPAEILRFIDGKYGYKGAGAVKTGKTISFLNLLSRNLKSLEGDKWVDKEQVGVLSPFVVYAFLGLVYEQNRPLFDEAAGGEAALRGSPLKELLAQKAQEKVFQFVTLAGNIEKRLQEFKTLAANSELPVEDKRKEVVSYFLNNADDYLNLIEFGLFTVSGDQPDSVFYKFKEVARNAVAVAKGIKTNNVAQVGVNALGLIRQVTGKDSRDETLQQLTYYVNFVTDMVNADSAKGISSVLQSYAVPSRSYRVIRQSARTVALAAFPGVYAGYESVDRGDGTRVFGITAPIGLSVGWGGKGSTSFSLFAPVVDIGAPLTFRWNTESGDLPQKVLLEQIFSPGLFGVWGIKNSPVALKVGTQYLPKLRSIKDGASQFEANAWHTSVSLSVDIPVMIFSQRY